MRHDRLDRAFLGTLAVLCVGVATRKLAEHFAPVFKANDFALVRVAGVLDRAVFSEGCDGFGVPEYFLASVLPGAGINVGTAGIGADRVRDVVCHCHSHEEVNDVAGNRHYFPVKSRSRLLKVLVSCWVKARSTSPTTAANSLLKYSSSLFAARSVMFST